MEQLETQTRHKRTQPRYNIYPNGRTSSMPPKIQYLSSGGRHGRCSWAPPGGWRCPGWGCRTPRARTSSTGWPRGTAPGATGRSPGNGECRCWPWAPRAPAAWRPVARPGSCSCGSLPAARADPGRQRAREERTQLSTGVSSGLAGATRILFVFI